jgi:hypothetical protein
VTPWRRVFDLSSDEARRKREAILHDPTTRHEVPSLDVGQVVYYKSSMNDILTVRIPSREKEAWQQVAKALGEDLSEFARKAVRQRVQAVQARHGSPWDDLLGSVRTDAPPATNLNVRKAMRSKRP